MTTLYVIATQSNTEPFVVGDKATIDATYGVTSEARRDGLYADDQQFAVPVKALMNDLELSFTWNASAHTWTLAGEDDDGPWVTEPAPAASEAEAVLAALLLLFTEGEDADAGTDEAEDA